MDDRKRRIVIRHLLTMTGGFDWNESVPYSDPRNTAGALEASPDWFWKRTPPGTIDTKGGLYLEARDLARVWQLWLQGGVWNGTRLVSESWVRESVTPSFTPMLRDVCLPSPRRVVYHMGMPATTSNWTVDMLDALPDDGQRYEIIDGELFVTPSPGEAHQDIVGALYRHLHQFLAGHGVGKAMISPVDVRRGDHSRNRVQPDVFVVRVTGGTRPAYPYALQDLLLAVEVASPGNPMLDYQIKRDLYLREGVGEYWIINPGARNVSRWCGRDDPGEVLSKRIEWHCDGMPSPFVLSLAEFFADALA